MCKYCENENKYSGEDLLDNDNYNEVIIHKNFLEIEINNCNKVIPINYCPMCRRKLTK